MPDPVCPNCGGRHMQKIACRVVHTPKPVVHKAEMVVHRPNVVVHKEPPVVHKKADRHRNTEERKAYKREWMRRKRAG